MSEMIEMKEGTAVPGRRTKQRTANLNPDQGDALERACVGVYVIQRGRFRYADDRLAEILGFENPQALHDQSFWQWVHPYDRKRVCLAKNRGPFRVLKPDGAVSWARMSGVNMPFEGKPANIGCLMDMGAIPETKVNGASLVLRDSSQLLHLLRTIIGKSAAMREVCQIVEHLADLETAALVTGESGTGKEHIARALHFSGCRAAKPFIGVHCAAPCESLMESELFGHARGACAGAVQDKHGRFHAADGGTLFIDEVGDLSPLIQLKLLRVLQEKSFERVGESISRKTDVRVIACTRQDLKRKVRNGEFREDLYYRLKTAEIILPPLRERKEDVPLLVEHFRRVFNSRFNKSIGGLSNDVLERLMAYHWPGNVGELEHVMERAFALCLDGEIAIAHLPPRIGDLNASTSGVTIIPIHASEGARDILEALSQACWNRSKAADLLGVSRQTLYRKIRAYRIFEMM